jgi:hypothetical protein
MATTNSVTLTSNAPIPQFDLSNLGTFPEDVLYNIFSNVVNSKDIQSLWGTCRHFRWVVLNCLPLWTTLLESHFPGSYTLSPNVKPIDVYKDCLELENTVRSGICKYQAILAGDTECMIEHDREMIVAARFNIAIWFHDKLRSIFPLQSAMAFVNAMVAYEDKLFVALNLNDTELSFDDSVLQVYSLISGDLIKELKGHRGRISAICKIENNLYSSSHDGTIKVWDMDTLQLLETLLDEEDIEQKIATQQHKIVMSMLPHKDMLYFADTGGCVNTYDPSTHKFGIFDSQVALPNFSIDKMLIHGNKFMSIIESEAISVIDFLSKRSLIPEISSFRVYDILGFGRLLFSARNDGVSVNIRDHNTGEKLMEHMFMSGNGKVADKSFISSSSMVFSDSKLYVISGALLHIFDFDVSQIRAFKQELERLTKVNGKLWIRPENTPYHMRALLLAIAQGNRSEIITCVDNLIAVDPKNKAFCELLCKITQGDDIPTYEFYNKNKSFDFREILRTASFNHIKRTANEFAKVLGNRGIQIESYRLPFQNFHHIEPNYDSSDSDDEN